MEKEYLDLKVDFMFKQLFGQQTQKHITIAFLNDLLGWQGTERIVDLTFENTEYPKETINGKSVRLDLKVFTSLGERINIEIQLLNQQDMPERTLYYWARMFSASIYTNDRYLKLPRTIMMTILNYPLFPSKTDRFHTIFHVAEDQEHFLWSDKLEIHLFDLSAFMVQWRKHRTNLRKQNQQQLPWLLMLSATDYRKKKTNSEMLAELEEWAMNIEQVKEALVEWELLSANKKNQEVYEAKMKELRDLLSNLEGYHQMGMEKGVEKGIEKGIELVARNMLKDGIELSIISKVTGLHEEDILKL